MVEAAMVWQALADTPPEAGCLQQVLMQQSRINSVCVQSQLLVVHS